jgi:ribosomal-protein-alanine N-acetyltransferase
MLALPDIRLALPMESRAIATMSRDFIERGLGWSWNSERVRRAIRDPSTNVAVVLVRDHVCGFGIMHYGDDAAHLSLLAVHPARRHQGLGARLVGWLEQCARIAGSTHIRLEARADNGSAIAFYHRLGFNQYGRVAGYYEGAVDAVRLEKRLS